MALDETAAALVGMIINNHKFHQDQRRSLNAEMLGYYRSHCPCISQYHKSHVSSFGRTDLDSMTFSSPLFSNHPCEAV